MWSSLGQAWAGSPKGGQILTKSGQDRENPKPDILGGQDEPGKSRVRIGDVEIKVETRQDESGRFEESGEVGTLCRGQGAFKIPIPILVGIGKGLPILPAHGWFWPS